MAGKLEVNDFI